MPEKEKTGRVLYGELSSVSAMSDGASVAGLRDPTSWPYFKIHPVLLCALGEDDMCPKESSKPGAHPSVSDPRTGGWSGQPG